jgi:hypothetical protein
MSYPISLLLTVGFILAVGTILGYVFYWLAVIAVLIYMKFTEGRTKLFGYESAAGKRRRESSALPPTQITVREIEKEAMTPDVVEESVHGVASLPR